MHFNFISSVKTKCHKRYCRNSAAFTALGMRSVQLNKDAQERLVDDITQTHAYSVFTAVVYGISSV